MCGPTTMKKSNSTVDLLEEGTTGIASEGGYQVFLTPRKMIVGLFLSTLLLIVCNVCTSVALVKLTTLTSTPPSSNLDVNSEGQLVLKGTDKVVETALPVPTITLQSEFLGIGVDNDNHNRNLQYDKSPIIYADSPMGPGWRMVQHQFAKIAKMEVMRLARMGLYSDVSILVGSCRYRGTIQAAKMADWNEKKWIQGIRIKATLPGTDQEDWGLYGLICDDPDDPYADYCTIHCDQTSEQKGYLSCFPLDWDHTALNTCMSPDV